MSNLMVMNSLLCLALVWGCASGQRQPTDATGTLPAVTLSLVAPEKLVVGGKLVFSGTNLDLVDQVRFEGTLSEKEVIVTVTPTSATSGELIVSMSQDVFDALGGSFAAFDGSVDLLHKGEVVLSAGVIFTFVPNLAPVATSLSNGPIYLGDRVTLQGENLLLPAEGVVNLVFDGVFSVADTSSIIPISKRKARVDVSSRDQGSFVVKTGLFGVLPGSFQGAVFLENAPREGEVETSKSLSVEGLALKATRIDGISPDNVSRGQKLTVFGRGFVPTDAESQSTTLLLLTGTLLTANGVVDYTGQQSLELVPQAIRDNTVMDYALRVKREFDGSLTGLGATPGSFVGTIAPLVLSGNVSYLGAPVSVKLTINPTLQVVYLRFLPGFSTSLADFGMGAVVAQVKSRILEVARRDYSGINIRFQDEEPLDFIEFAAVEIGGVDPNGANLFGIDNTCHGENCKDIGNFHLDDVIGGLNASSQQQGYYAYGGVFLHSFLQFSPTLATEPLPIVSTRFDDIFSFCVPSLGGTPVTEADLTGARKDLVDEAVRVLGNLVGNTITHEVGHTLGLAAIEGRFHNEGDTPGYIMDAGIHRPFEERAEIDGAAAPVFSPVNRSYLELILPLK